MSGQSAGRIPIPSLEQLQARSRAAVAGHPSAQAPAAQATLGLADTPQAARLARVFTAAVLAEGEWDRVRETTMLLVSELVTNALRHTPGGSRLEVRLDESRLRVDLFDGNTRPPVVQHPAPEDEGGRGLALVEELADRWGWQRTTAGKRVWFELDSVAIERA